MSPWYIWNIMLDGSGSKPVYCFETKHLYQIAAAITFIFTKLHAHYALLQIEVLCLPFGKSKVSHTAVNSLCHKRVKTNQTASNSVLSDNGCKYEQQLKDELGRESSAARKPITDKNSTLFHNGLSLQNISVIQND